jgi:hypothetical protein
VHTLRSERHQLGRDQIQVRQILLQNALDLRALLFAPDFIASSTVRSESAWICGCVTTLTVCGISLAVSASFEPTVVGGLRLPAAVAGSVPAVTWQRNQQFYGTLEADLTPTTLLRLGVSYTDICGKLMYGLPNNTDYTTPNVSRSTYLGPDWNWFSNQRTNAFAEVEQSSARDGRPGSRITSCARAPTCSQARRPSTTPC